MGDKHSNLWHLTPELSKSCSKSSRTFQSRKTLDDFLAVQKFIARVTLENVINAGLGVLHVFLWTVVVIIVVCKFSKSLAYRASQISASQTSASHISASQMQEHLVRNSITKDQYLHTHIVSGT